MEVAILELAAVGEKFAEQQMAVAGEVEMHLRRAPGEGSAEGIILGLHFDRLGNDVLDQRIIFGELGLLLGHAGGGEAIRDGGIELVALLALLGGVSLRPYWSLNSTGRSGMPR